MQESTYKIISVKKKHPIFICKAIPVPHPPLPSPPSHNNLFFKNQLKKVHSKFSSSKLQNNPSKEAGTPSPSPSPRLEYIVNRSSSCDLQKQQSKNIFPNELQSKRKEIKSIKEYLRFAYRRNQKERKVIVPKLPQIHKQEQKKQINLQHQEVFRNSSDLQNVTNMKQALRRIRRKDQLPKAIINTPQKQQQNGFFVQNLSGWQQNGNPQYFQH